MSQPNPKSEREEALFQLHLDAGFLPAGLDEDKEQLWQGTDKEWEKYAMMEAAFLEGVTEEMPF